MFPGRGHTTGRSTDSSGHRGEAAVPPFVEALREAVVEERAALCKNDPDCVLACDGVVTESFFTLTNYETRELRLVEVAWPHRPN